MNSPRCVPVHQEQSPVCKTPSPGNIHLAPSTPSRTQRVTAQQLLDRFSPRSRPEVRSGLTTDHRCHSAAGSRHTITSRPDPEFIEISDDTNNEQDDDVIVLRESRFPGANWNRNPFEPPVDRNADLLTRPHDAGLGGRSAIKRKSSTSSQVLKTGSSNGSLYQVAKQKEQSFFATHSAYFEPLIEENSVMNRQGALLAPAAEFSDLHKQPAGLKAILKPYQLRGLSFLVWLYRNGTSGILGDEMGLGKTLQSLALFQYLKETGPRNITNLVVCPLSVLNTWVTEARRFTPTLTILRFHGPSRERKGQKELLRRQLHSTDVVITTYESFVAEESFFRRSNDWLFTILDEGHRLKDSKTLVSSKFRGLKTSHMVILTGTPLQNNLHELWSMLHLLFPSLFTTKTEDKFKNAFNLSKGQVEATMILHCRKLLELVMLRRMKSSPGVNLGLPAKKEVLLFAPLTSFQRRWYLKLLTRLEDSALTEVFESGGIGEASPSGDPGRSTVVKTASEAKSSSWKVLQNLLMQLRKICDHPFLIAEANEEANAKNNIVTVSSKFLLLEKLIHELVLRKQRKLLVFSEFQATLDCIEELLRMRGGDGSSYRFLRLDGSTPRARRNLNVRLFQDTTSNYKVFLISTKAGGLGINLTAAKDVVIVDHDWNPQNTLQAEARAHRIGQTEPVTVYKLCTEGTVEEQMLSRIQKKLYLSLKVAEGLQDIHDNMTSLGSSLSTQKQHEDFGSDFSAGELQNLLRRGTRALSRTSIDARDIQTMDFATMIKNCTNQAHDSEMTDSSDSGKEEQQWLREIERIRCQDFEGKAHGRAKTNEPEELTTTLVRADRRKGKEMTVIQDGWVISKQSAGCSDWEAVPTLAGKDPRLADRKREKKEQIPHQQHCHACQGRGELMECSACPRCYHKSCLDKAAVGRVSMFRCPAHRCHDCSKPLSDCGGLLFRCIERGCSRSSCEDCLDWDHTTLVGESLAEFEQLGFVAHNTYWVTCPRCNVNMTTPRSLCASPVVEATTPSLDRHGSSRSSRGDITPPSTPTTFRTASTPGSFKRKFADMELGNEGAGLVGQRSADPIIILD